MSLLEEVCKKLEGLNADMWSADNYEDTKLYGVLLGNYHINPMRGFFVNIKKELRPWGIPDNYYIKIRHSNSLDDITFGGSNSKTEEERIKSLFAGVDAKVKEYRKELLESEDKTRILRELLKEFNEP